MDETSTAQSRRTAKEKRRFTKWLLFNFNSFIYFVYLYTILSISYLFLSILTIIYQQGENKRRNTFPWGNSKFCLGTFGL